MGGNEILVGVRDAGIADPDLDPREAQLRGGPPGLLAQPRVELNKQCEHATAVLCEHGQHAAAVTGTDADQAQLTVGWSGAHEGSDYLALHDLQSPGQR